MFNRLFLGMKDLQVEYFIMENHSFYRRVLNYELEHIGSPSLAHEHLEKSIRITINGYLGKVKCHRKSLQFNLYI